MELNKLKGKLTEMKCTYEDCANTLGISITSFANKINGKSSFKLLEVKKLSDFLRLSPDEIVSIFLV